MGNSKDYAQSITDIRQAIKDLDHKMTYGEYGYKLTSVIENHASLFDRFCPFKIGDRVILTQTPEISNTVAYGWLSAKHFLIEGAIAVVYSTDYYRGKFRFGLVFEDDSYMDKYGQIHPVSSDRRGTFLFSEDVLVKAE